MGGKVAAPLNHHRNSRQEHFTTLYPPPLPHTLHLQLPFWRPVPWG